MAKNVPHEIRIIGPYDKERVLVCKSKREAVSCLEELWASVSITNGMLHGSVWLNHNHEQSILNLNGVRDVYMRRIE